MPQNRLVLLSTALNECVVKWTAWRGWVSRIAVIPGDGIGPEVMAEALRLLEQLRDKGRALSWDVLPYSAETFLRDGSAMPPGALGQLSSYDAILLGAFGDARVPDMAHGREVVLGLRQGLGLYVNMRPVRLLREELTPLKGRAESDIDLVILRENTEGLYSHAGGFLRKGTKDETAVQSSIDTRFGAERFLRYAFSFAAKRPNAKLALVDKHNALRYSGDLWYRTFLDVASEFPGVSAEHRFIDAACAEMVLAPGHFSVVAADNLFGDILGDLGAALVGGLGFAPSANINPETGKGMFEPVHGSAPDIAGRGIANPCAALLACSMMLEHLGDAESAAVVENAVRKALAEGARTRDAGGALTTREIGQKILNRLELP